MALNDVVLNRTRVTDQITDILKQAILSGEFKPGDKFPREDQIAAQFKVSKVSVREALRNLEMRDSLKSAEVYSEGTLLLSRACIRWTS